MSSSKSRLVSVTYADQKAWGIRLKPAPPKHKDQLPKDSFEKPPGGVGSEPGDRQDWQRISGKKRRKSMPVLSVPGALVGGDEVTKAVFQELSVAVGMPVARHPPHRSVRALLTHTVL